MTSPYVNGSKAVACEGQAMLMVGRGQNVIEKNSLVVSHVVGSALMYIQDCLPVFLLTL